eukprot:scpid3878/ scgid24807/ Talin-1
MSIPLRVEFPAIPTVQSRTLRFNLEGTVGDACRLIRDNNPEVEALRSSNDYGIHITDVPGSQRGVWLDDERILSYYKMIRPMSTIEYRKKTRPLRVKMKDSSVKMIMANDAAPVNTIIQQICERVGISNWESYSLVMEDNDEDKFRTMSRRESMSFRNSKKMEKLRSILHTEDGVNWINHDKSLSEQGVSEDMILTLRVKFWGDSNIDRNDPVHLNLIFAEARDSIIHGTHPVTEEEAVSFAAIHAQEQFGNYDATKVKSFHSYIKDLLPSDYRKVRGIEQHVIDEYSKLTGLSEHNARFRYVDLFRSLKTFGVSFFLVKEKQPGKNRLVPRLLGIARDSIMRVDEKTKKILKVWPLTKLKDWAASTKAFTLNFGEHADGVYSVQTLEGETMSQLIGGYIDIIIKKTHESENPLMDDESSEVVSAMSILPGHATVVEYANGAGPNQGSLANQSSPLHHLSGPNAGRVLSPEENSLSNAIHSVMTQIGSFLPEIQRVLEDRALADDMDMAAWHDGKFAVHRQQFLTLVSNIASATAQLVLLTSVDPVDVNFVGVEQAVNTISSSLERLLETAKIMAHHLPDDLNLREKMLDACRNLMLSTTNMLNTALPENDMERSQLLQSVNELGVAAGNLLGLFSELCPEQAYQDELLALAYQVAQASRVLGDEVKVVAAECEDTVLKEEVGKTAIASTTSGTELVSCTRVLAIHLPEESAKSQLLEAATRVKKAAATAVGTSENASYDSHVLDRIGHKSGAVDHAVEAYVAKLNEGPRSAWRSTNAELCEAILTALDQLKGSVSTPAVIEDMGTAGRAASRLVSSLRDQARGLNDPDDSQRLMDSARLLTEATARLVEAAKLNNKNPGSPASEDTLHEGIEDLKEAVWAAVGDDYRRLLLARLEAAARRACATSTQLTVTSSAVVEDIDNEHRKEDLQRVCGSVDDEVGSLGTALKNLQYNPERAQAQLRLLTTAPGLLQPGTELLVLAKTTHAIVQRDDLASDLLAVLKGVVVALAELKAAINAFSEAGGLLNLDAAVETVNDLAELVNEDVEMIARDDWQRASNKTLQGATVQLTEDARSVGATMAGLVGAAAKRDDVLTGQAAQSVAEALTELVESSRDVAGGCPSDRPGQKLLLTSVVSALSTSVGLLQAARDSVTGAGGQDGNRNLVAAAKAVQEALANILGLLPHVRRMDADIERISNAAVVSDVVRSFQEAQSNFSDRAAGLNEAVANLLEAARTGDMSLAEAAQRLADDFLSMLNAAKAVDDAGNSENSRLMAHAQGVSSAAARLLEASKRFMVGDLDSKSLMSSLTDAARDVTDTMNSLLGLALASRPGQKECEAAERAVQDASGYLALTGKPLSSEDYFTCERIVKDKAMALNTALTTMTSSLRNEELERVQSAAPQFGEDVSAAVRAAAQCALLSCGESPLSEPLYALRVACDRLQDPRCEGRQLLAQATEINKQSAAVRKIALGMAETSSVAEVKRFYMESARETTGLTAAVVQGVTKLASASTDANREVCAEKSTALVMAVEQLVSFSMAPPGTLPPTDGTPMEVPVLDPARSLVASSSAYLLAARDICKGTAGSDPDWHALAQHSRDVSNALQRLLEDIVDNAPGQRECEEAAQQLRKEMLHVDQALVGAVSHTLKPIKTSTLEAYHEQTMGALIDVHDRIEPLVAAAKTNPIDLAQRVTVASQPFAKLSSDIVGAASNIVDHNSQVTVLKCCKSLMESMLQLVNSAKEAGGNPEATQTHASLASAANATRSSIQRLSAEMESASSSSGALTSMVEGVEDAMMMLDQPLSETPPGSFQEYAENVDQTARWIASESQKLIAKSSSHPDALPAMMESIGTAYQSLIKDTRSAMAVTEEEGVAVVLCRSAKALGQSTTRLLLACSGVHGDPSDMNAKHGLAAAARALSEKVSDLLSALQAGSRGVQACIEAIQELEGIVSEIETNVLFVSAGTLIPDDKNDVFANHKDTLFSQTKSIIDHIKPLLMGAATSSERLALEANAIVSCTRDLAESGRAAAASLGVNDKASQVALLNACKDVASSLCNLLDVSKNASGKSPTSPEIESLRVVAKTVMGAVSKFMETVKSCDSEATRGVMALRSASQQIQEHLDVLYDPVMSNRAVSADDLIQASKLIPSCTAKLQTVGRTRKREDALATAPVVEECVTGLLAKCRAASASAETAEAQQRCLQAGQQCGEAFIAMMQHVSDILVSPSAEKTKRLLDYSRDIAKSVNLVVKAAESLKSGYVNPNDPNVIAEQELLAAAAAIDAASRKLSELKPRESARMADESLSFDEQILEAAKAIALATSALIKWATATQRELVTQGRVTTSGSRYIQDDDGAWSDGLVSAAKMVAEMTSQLCEAANLLVRGQASEDKLIAASMGVSQATIQLIMACQVKADPDSESAGKLQDAGKAVDRASGNLVKAASEAARMNDSAAADAAVGNASGVSLTSVQRIRAQLELRERINEQERSLAAEYARLEEMRRDPYEKAASSRSSRKRNSKIL